VHRDTKSLGTAAQNKVEKQWRQSISLFQTIPNKQHVRQMLAYPDSAIGAIEKHLY
jgi:hypothetical protein